MVKAYQNEEKPQEQPPVEGSDVATSVFGVPLKPTDSVVAPTIIDGNIQNKYFKVYPNGDITLGDYDAGQGIKWDQETETLDIQGGLTVDHLDIPDTTTANSFHVDTEGNTWWGATAIGSAVAKVLKTGVATFTNVTATGTMNATGGYVGSTTALVYESQGINCGTTGYIRGGQTDYFTGTGFFLGYSGAAYKFSIGSSTQYLTWDGSNLALAGNLQSVRNYTAGMALSAGNAILIGNNTDTNIVGNTTTSTAETTTFGDVGGNSIVAQRFTVPATAGGELITKIEIRIKKIGSPTYNVVMEVQTDGLAGQQPSGTVSISCGTLAGTSITTSFANYTFTFSASVLSASTAYWIVLYRSGSADNSNYYEINGVAAGAGDRVARYDGSWTYLNRITYHQVNQKFLIGSCYKTGAGTTRTSNTFAGYAMVAGTYGNSVSTQVSGVYITTGLSGGSVYYLSDTFGAIATSAGTVSKKVGLALSSTDLSINYTL